MDKGDACPSRPGLFFILYGVKAYATIYQILRHSEII